MLIQICSIFDPFFKRWIYKDTPILYLIRSSIQFAQQTFLMTPEVYSQGKECENVYYTAVIPQNIFAASKDLWPCNYWLRSIMSTFNSPWWLFLFIQGLFASEYFHCPQHLVSRILTMQCEAKVPFFTYFEIATFWFHFIHPTPFCNSSHQNLTLCIYLCASGDHGTDHPGSCAKIPKHLGNKKLCVPKSLHNHKVMIIGR